MFCRFRIFLTVLLTVAFASGAMAQSDNSALMSQWAVTAARAESILKTGLASTPAMEALRVDLVDQREEAAAVEAAGKARVAPLRVQLDALGPAPEDGPSEPVELAERRAQLESNIAEENAPVLIAQAAYQRAEGFIAEIDTIVRSRFSQQLVELGPSPLAPASWPVAVHDLKTFFDHVVSEITEKFTLKSGRAELVKKAPVALLFAAVGLWMLFGVRREFSALLRKVFSLGREVKGWQASVANLARLIVPMMGALVMTVALLSSGLFGAWGLSLVEILPSVAFILIAAPWLGRGIFRPESGKEGLIGTRGAGMQRGYRISIGLGIVFALSLIFETIAIKGGFSSATQAVLQFPFILMASFLLYHLSRIMQGKLETAAEQTESHESTVFGFASFISRVLLIVTIAAPVLAAVGYFAASQYLIFPTILTLAYMAGVLIFFYMVRSILNYWIEGDANELRRDQFRLLPVFIGFVLAIGSIPVLALIWGARTSDIQDIWKLLSDGVPIGESHLSLTNFFVFAAVFAIGYAATRLLQKTVRRTVLPKTKMDIGGKTAVLTGIGYVGVTLAAFAAISAAGINLSSLAIVAGAMSVGIGFGLQTIVSNFVSGLILLIERPIKEGDWIQAGGFEGIVRKVSIRATLVDTFDRCAVIIPNSDLIAGAVTNWTAPDKTGRLKVQVGVAYGTDPEKVKDILLSIGEAQAEALKYPAPSVIFQNFGASALDFELRVFLRDVGNMLSVKSNINFAIAKRFAEEGIEIPFDQSDVTLKNVDEIGKALTGAIVGAQKANS